MGTLVCEHGNLRRQCAECELALLRRAISTAHTRIAYRLAELERVHCDIYPSDDESSAMAEMRAAVRALSELGR